MRPARSPLQVAGSVEGRDQRRYAQTPWRAWYDTARWRKLKRRALERDEWRCRHTGVDLVGGIGQPNSPVVDHIVPHKGDPSLFWDLDNIQSVSKAYHDGEKQALERAAEARS